MSFFPKLTTRDEALQIGQALLELGLFHHVTHGEPFVDKTSCYYRFYQAFAC